MLRASSEEGSGIITPIAFDIATIIPYSWAIRMRFFAVNSIGTLYDKFFY